MCKVVPKDPDIVGIIRKYYFVLAYGNLQIGGEGEGVGSMLAEFICETQYTNCFFFFPHPLPFLLFLFPPPFLFPYQEGGKRFTLVLDRG